MQARCQLKIIAAILEQPVIEKILTHLGLDPQLPPKARSREAAARQPLCVDVDGFSLRAAVAASRVGPPPRSGSATSQ